MTCGLRFVLTFDHSEGYFQGVSRHFEKGEEDVSANILRGGNPWMTKFMVKIAMNAGGGEGMGNF